MATRKCKKPSANAVQVAQASDILLIPPAPATTKEAPAVTRACHTPSEAAATRAHVVPAGDLTTISELDKLDGLDSGLHSDLLLGPDFGELAGEIMSVVTGHSGGAVEFEEEHEEEEMSEDFNFDRIMATTDNEQESSPEIGSEIDNDMGEIHQRHSYPTAQCAPAKRAPPVKTVGKSKGKGKAIPKPTSSEHYDPDTCIFKIQCAVQQLHG
ncbi:hypothetical protein PAXRUDRAFT_11744 [Paxillus rubicundulus Ve08.2h10]|uniref:Uncharacterized protein n=1 Tax=Paxillus rubicundulus Ve08.2h10 TaxID=930991 RepID=A0A0D0DQT1_9AGAM|nr:hypothetical protein PAXRUDRAFT_11744 [Paxillus rubicundulus Ve08.2h10]